MEGKESQFNLAQRQKKGPHRKKGKTPTKKKKVASSPISTELNDHVNGTGKRGARQAKKSPAKGKKTPPSQKKAPQKRKIFLLAANAD